MSDTGRCTSENRGRRLSSEWREPTSRVDSRCGRVGQSKYGQALDRSHKNLFCNGCLSMRGREGWLHVLPRRSPKQVQPAARSDVPGSDFNVYVISLRYPRALHALHAAPYKIEQALGVPSVATRVTSAVHPSSLPIDTGLPTIQTPTIFSSSATAKANSAVVGGRWCRWYWRTYCFASEMVQGTISI